MVQYDQSSLSTLALLFKVNRNASVSKGLRMDSAQFKSVTKSTLHVLVLQFDLCSHQQIVHSKL
jgi:hypothetical protein